MKIYLWALLFFAVIFNHSCQNTGEENSKAVEVEHSTKVLQRSISKNDSIAGKAIEDSLINQGLVNIQDISPDLLVDLKYSTRDNFFKKDVYGTFTHAYLQVKPSEGLKKAQEYLTSLYPNYTLIVYDAARPLHIQKVLWAALDSIPPSKRKDFVADPSEGSIHNYGCAVDLSIYERVAKKTLDMGTEYDFFGPMAYPKYEQKMIKSGELSNEALQNRKLLRKVMAFGGFEPITSEWWHFNFYSRAKAKELFSIIK
jgi:zinc D-Ala-D-Ala dipeptidase